MSLSIRPGYGRRYELKERFTNSGNGEDYLDPLTGEDVSFILTHFINCNHGRHKSDEFADAFLRDHLSVQEDTMRFIFDLIYSYKSASSAISLKYGIAKESRSKPSRVCTIKQGGSNTFFANAASR